MEAKIYSMHFVFGFKQGSFGVASTRFADLLNKFTDLISDGSPYILPMGEEAPIDIPIMSLDGKDTRIVISKDRLNVFFDGQENNGNLDSFVDLIKNVYKKFKDENFFEISWIGFITYNELQKPEEKTEEKQAQSNLLDYLNKDKRNEFLNGDLSRINIRIEQKKSLDIGNCNYILDTVDVKKEEKYVSTIIFDINTKPQTTFSLNEENLNTFFSIYEQEKSSSFKIFR